MSKQETSGSTAPAQSQSLYRKYRPTSFDPSQLVGQEHVARTLRNAITLDRVAHAYLFCGPRGTGKTSTARLLAKAVNCEAEDPADRPCNQCGPCQAINSGSVVDIIEIDAASNRGVDDIRDLREKVRYAPTQLAVKFYIIDEAHQLTRDAFNAFLKTLEEPPGHVKFVLATTEAEKLPDTVASRCQRFDFRRIPVDSTIQRLQQICEWEAIEAEDEALLLIARHATGSLRDALGLLDQLALYGEHDEGRRSLTAQTVRQVLGLSQNDRLTGIIEAILNQDPGEGLRIITEASDQGEDVHQLNRQMIGYLRLLLHISAGGKPPEADDVAVELAGRFSLDRLSALVRIFTEIDAAANKTSYPQLPLELAIVRASVGEQAAPVAPAQPARPAVQETAPSGPREPQPRRTPEKPAPAPEAQPAEHTRKRAPSTPKAAERDTEQPAEPSRAAPAAPAPAGDGMLEHLHANWGHIKRDVKAENSRIAALLSSADPAAVTENQIILAAPYEFHRTKLNDEPVRTVVEGVLQRYTHTSHQLLCVAPEDVPSSTDTSTPPPSDQQATHDAATNRDLSPVENGTAGKVAETAESPASMASDGSIANPDEPAPDSPANTPEENEVSAATESQPEADDSELEPDQQRYQAAKSIFEAKEIDD